MQSNCGVNSPAILRFLSAPLNEQVAKLGSTKETGAVLFGLARYLLISSIVLAEHSIRPGKQQVKQNPLESLIFLHILTRCEHTRNRISLCLCGRMTQCI